MSGSDRGCLDTVRLSGPRPLASLTMRDQALAGGSTQSVLVDSIDLPEGGYVGIPTTPLQTDDLAATLVGASAYLSRGGTTNAAIMLQSGLGGGQEVVAIPHRDTNGAHSTSPRTRPSTGPTATGPATP